LSSEHVLADGEVTIYQLLLPNLYSLWMEFIQ